MSGVAGVARVIDRANEWIGRGTAWLTLFMVVLQFAVVLLRYVFGVGHVLFQEAILYAHAFVFLIAAGYTLLHDGHVRVDIFYAGAGPRGRAWVDLIGSVVLLGATVVVIWTTAWPYVANSWRVLESSPEGSSGIQGVFLLKSLILAHAVLLGLQGISLVLKSIAVLAGRRTAGGAAPEGGHGL